MTAKFRPFPESDFEAWLQAEIGWRVEYRDKLLRGDDVDPTPTDENIRRLLSDGPLSPTSSVRSLFVDGEDVGWAWLMQSDNLDFVLVDAELRDDRHVGALDECTAQLAREHGADLLNAEVTGPRISMQRLTADARWHPTWANMALRLDQAVMGPAAELHPMRPEVVDDYLAFEIDEYARELVMTGMAPEAARADSAAEHARLLPKGLSTPDQYLFEVFEEGDTVGTLWLGRRSERSAWVWDIVVDEQARGRGIGRRTMNAAADWCRTHDVDILGLNVFGHNGVARHLYDSLGYEAVSENFARSL